MCNALKAELSTAKVPLRKLVSITADGAAIARFQGDPDFPQFMAFHCLRHNLSLAAKKLVDVSVVEDVSRMINNEGSMLDRFYQHLTNTGVFLESTGGESKDVDWLMRFTYLTDITEIINTTDKDMKRDMKFIGEYFGSLDRLRAYMESAIDCFKRNVVPHSFSRLTKVAAELGVPNFDGRLMFEYTKSFLNALTMRLKDYSDVRAIVNYFKEPFDKSVCAFELISIIAKLHPVDKCVLKFELDDLRLDSKLRKSRKTDNDIWRLMDDTAYPNLNMVYKRTLRYFGTSCLSESIFPSLKHVKDEHLQAVRHISTSTYEPHLDELARGWGEHNLEEK